MGRGGELNRTYRMNRMGEAIQVKTRAWRGGGKLDGWRLRVVEPPGRAADRKGEGNVDGDGTGMYRPCWGRNNPVW